MSGTNVTLGGERLGSGNKQKVHLRDYERSNHDIGFIWRSTMAAGTLVPFWSQVALPGAKYDISLDCDVMTHPTIGPLFGSYKVQLDVFLCPIRNYQGDLHMNALGIGLDMSKVKLPQLALEATPPTAANFNDSLQINSSCILNYLGLRGIGRGQELVPPYREINAVPLLAYWDIYKNYYANKQEEIGAVIHNNLEVTESEMEEVSVKLSASGAGFILPELQQEESTPAPVSYAFSGYTKPTAEIVFEMNPYDGEFDIDLLRVTVGQYNVYSGNVEAQTVYIRQLFANWTWEDGSLGGGILRGTIPINPFTGEQITEQNQPFVHWAGYLFDTELRSLFDARPKINVFRLADIDRMRTEILKHSGEQGAFIINDTNLEPYKFLTHKVIGDDIYYSKQSTQEGLALKTYQSDLFNNWISTEWIDGENGINEITKVTITDDAFTIDEFMLSQKIYNMLNRIAISGGTYDDWLDAVYTHERVKSVENPMYMGGLIKELAFQEVISNASSPGEPLGSLAGRGKLTGKHKGGQMEIRVDEPSYIMGIVSITPRIDYSQGNQFDMNFKTMNDFHKPGLDGIGFQDLITDQMAWWETIAHGGETPQFITRSAGKQPAWVNYMTNVNRVKGNFAEQNDQMFMVLNRRYEPHWEGNTATIKDLTTYIDPAKFNHIFADTRLDAQNFWTQIKVDCEARMKMSAKIIPNL